MKKPLIFSLLLSLFFFSTWSFLWFFAAGQIKKQAENFISHSKEENLLITVKSLSVGNYPFTPEIRFSGRISIDSQTLDVPELLIRSFFLPEKPLYIEASQGLSLLEPADTALLSVESLFLEVTVPSSLPASVEHEDLKLWKEANGAIDLKNLNLKKGALHLTGRGTLTLDDTLQPTGEMILHMTGHLAFIEWLRQNRYVGIKETLLSSAVLTGLSKTDPQTNKSYVDTSLTLQNRILFANSLRLLEFPEILWP